MSSITDLLLHLYYLTRFHQPRSDISDDISTEHQDVVGDDDDLGSGVFVFQPPTSGTLFPSQTAETKKHKILLVEDNKINIVAVKSMMKQLGYTIDAVSNGAEAVQAVQCNT